MKEEEVRWSQAPTKEGDDSIYFLDTPTPSSPPTIDPQTARLALVDRLHLGDYYSLGNIDDSVLEQLNDLSSGGSDQQSLFSTDASTQPSLLLVLDSDEDSNLVPDGWSPTARLGSVPSEALTRTMLNDLAEKAAARDASGDVDGRLQSLLQEISEAKILSAGDRTIVHLPSLRVRVTPRPINSNCLLTTMLDTEGVIQQGIRSRCRRHHQDPFQTRFQLLDHLILSRHTPFQIRQERVMGHWTKE